MRAAPPLPAQPRVAPPAEPSASASGRLSRRQFFLSIFGWFPFFRRKKFTLAGIEFRVLRKGSSKRRYLFIHGNEPTAREVLTAHMQRYSGTAHLVTGSDRYITVRGIRFDPNRIWSPEGAGKNLRTLNTGAAEDSIGHTLRILNRDRDKLIRRLIPPDHGLLVAVHNNAQGYSVNDEIENSDRTSLPDRGNPHEFMLATSPADFDRLARSPFNVVLQNTAPKEDDGSIISTVSEVRAMGGSSHPALGFLGVMSAKNTAVNILILTTYVSFLLYRRSGKILIVPWAKKGNLAQLAIFLVAASIVIFLGVYGYFVEAAVRIAFSIPQVLSVLVAMIAVTVIDVFLFKNAAKAGEPRWGQIAPISQYVLIFIAVTFTWLMGLMGYVRSGLRQHWHVYGVMRDTSVDAFTPTLGFATKVVSVTVLIFFLLIGFVFWLSGLSGKKDWKPKAESVAIPAEGAEEGAVA